MRRRLLTALLAGLLLPAGLAGCGIPDQTEVLVDGPVGPATESGSANGSADQPPTARASSDPKQFVLNYLAAAAGEREQAYDRVKEFIAPEGQGLLRVKQKSSEIELNVVHLAEIPEVTQNNDGTSVVRVGVQQLGVLRADGSLAPPEERETEYSFRLRPADSGGGLLITAPPPVLLLSVDALGYYYRARTIYFWNSDQTRLVPDQRYVSSAMSVERRVTEVVRWLAGGPSDWLASEVTGLPDGTAPINNATVADGRWEVNLTMPGADDARLARLATQLAWSLPELTGELQLKIQNQARLSVDFTQERDSHPLYPTAGNPQRFCVYDGAIRPLALTGETSGPVPVAASANKGIVAAGLSRSGDQVLAALVVTAPDRRQRLAVGFGPDPVAVFTQSRPFRSISRPVWLRSAGPGHPTGLVAADGELYRFTGTGVLSRISLGTSGPVTAVAASLEGHRIALIIDGALYVAAVSVDGEVVSVGQPRRLVTRLTDITAVDWYSEDKLVFAGSEGQGHGATPASENAVSGRPAVYETTVDGALETALKRDIGARATHLAAYPGGSAGGLPSLSYMYEANKVAYRNNPDEKLTRAQVRDVPPAAADDKAANPTAPFFYY